MMPKMTDDNVKEVRNTAFPSPDVLQQARY